MFITKNSDVCVCVYVYCRVDSLSADVSII